MLGAMSSRKTWSITRAPVWRPTVSLRGICAEAASSKYFPAQTSPGLEQAVERPRKSHILYERLQIRDAVHHGNPPSKAVLGIFFSVITVGAQIEAD